MTCQLGRSCARGRGGAVAAPRRPPPPAPAAKPGGCPPPPQVVALADATAARATRTAPSVDVGPPPCLEVAVIAVAAASPSRRKRTIAQPTGSNLARRAWARGTRRSCNAAPPHEAPPPPSS